MLTYLHHNGTWPFEIYPFYMGSLFFKMRNMTLKSDKSKCKLVICKCLFLIGLMLTYLHHNGTWSFEIYPFYMGSLFFKMRNRTLKIDKSKCKLVVCK